MALERKRKFLVILEEAEGKRTIPNPLPDWIGLEVTDVPEFTNMRLAWIYGKR